MNRDHMSVPAWERFEQVVVGEPVTVADDATDELEEIGLIRWGGDEGDFFVMTREGVAFAAQEGLH